jgi:DNA-binding transcriptional MerR regulator
VILQKPCRKGEIELGDLSTVQVAKKLKVSRKTLQRWFKEGLEKPRLQRIGGQRVRLWNDDDLRRARAYMRRRYWKKNYEKENAK